MTFQNDQIRPGVLRTPDSQFQNLPGYDFADHYVNVLDYRMHYVDEGNSAGRPVLMLHGEPTWSYLYRKMIAPVADAGHRVIAPDLIGFGKSDKPAEISTHTYAFHVAAIKEFIEELELNNIILMCQDWGSLIGLRVAAENPERFAGIVLANGGLPKGEAQMSEGFMRWRGQAEQMQKAGDMPIGVIAGRDFGPEIVAAYDAPFPDARYKAGPLAMPLLVPISKDDPASKANLAAWEVLKSWDKPFLTAFSDGDPITGGGERIFQRLVPGAKNQQHVTIEGAGHFLQEAKGEELAKVINQFIAANF